MKQKIFAGIATGIIVMAGVISPAFGFVANTFQTKHASAQCVGTPCVPVVGPQQQSANPVTPLVTPVYQGPGGGPNGEGAETQSGIVTSVGDPVTPPSQEATGTTATELECGVNFICAFVMITSQVLMFMPNLLATVAGLVMDFSLWYSLQSSTYTAYDGTVGNEGIVVTGWKLVRDFSNLLFIFALFVIAFTLILGLDERAEGAPMGLDPKRTIARVIIMALLVNFSFFLGRAVIDLTDVVALTFYNKITAAPQTTPGATTAASSDVKGGPGDPGSFYENAAGIRSISTGILAQVNPQSLLLNNKDVHGSGILWKSYDWSTYISIYFLSLVAAGFNLFLVYIFGVIAILFISRTIGLFIGIIISPIAFVSYTIPALQKKDFIGFDDWLKQFLGLAFMAPIFLFFLYIALQFFNISGLDKGSGYLATTAQILVKLALVGFLLVYAKNVAKDLAGKTGEMVSGAVTSLATGAAVVAGAVATGGLSGAARLGTRMAKEKITETARGVGTAALGEERFNAMSTQWDRAGGFKMLKGRGVMSSLNTMGRVATAGAPREGLINSFREAGVANRVYDAKRSKEALAKAKAEKEKKDNYEIAKRTKDVDKDLANAKKDLDDGILTPKEYAEKRKELAQKRKDIVSEVTDPTFAAKKADSEAKSSLAAAEKERNESNIDEKVAVAEQKVIDLQTKLTQSNADLVEATTKAADATTARVAVDGEVATTEGAFNAAKAAGDAIAKDLSDVEKDLAALPKTGFGTDPTKRIALEDKRAKLLTDQTAANTETTIRGAAWNDAKLKQRDAVSTEQAAINSKSAIEATIATDEAAKTVAEAEHEEVGGTHANLVSLIEHLENDATAAAGALKNKKTEVELQEEIRKRTIVPKTDTVSRKNNAARVQELQDRLRDISGGGSTTP